MNLIKFGDFYLLEFYNVSFFGRGWNPADFRISGHYVVLLSTKLDEFMFWKNSDYGGLTWVNEVNNENIEWKDYEVSFMNDEVLTDFNRTSYKYTDGMESMWDFLYKESREIYINRWKTWHRYKFNHIMTGLSPRDGDIIEVVASEGDLVMGERSEFSFRCSEYWVRKVMRGVNFFKIVDRTKYDHSIKESKIQPKFPRSEAGEVEDMFDTHFFGTQSAG